MPDRPIAVRACVFDAYGTLFDFASAAAGCSDVPSEKKTALTTLWRDKQLQYSWLRGLQGRHADFWQVTGDALDFTLETLGLAEPALRERLMNLYRTLACFPEVPETLRRLKEAGFVTAILSNGSPQMLQDAVAGSKLGGVLDHVLSVEEAGVFKPHPKVYQLALDRLSLRHARRLVQPLRPTPRAPARYARPRNPLARRVAAAADTGDLVSESQS